MELCKVYSPFAKNIVENFVFHSMLASRRHLCLAKEPNFISPLLLNDQKIEFVSSWKYLGCTVVSGTKLSFSTTAELGAFYASSNSILRSLKKPNELVLMNLLFSNCVANLTYCSEVKELSSNDMNKCNVALNDAIRRIFTFHRWESTRLLRQQLGFPNIYEIFDSRKRRFQSGNAASTNMVVRAITVGLSVLSG